MSPDKPDQTIGDKIMKTSSNNNNIESNNRVINYDIEIVRDFDGTYYVNARNELHEHIKGLPEYLPYKELKKAVKEALGVTLPPLKSLTFEGNGRKQYANAYGLQGIEIHQEPLAFGLQDKVILGSFGESRPYAIGCTVTAYKWSTKIGEFMYRLQGDDGKEYWDVARNIIHERTELYNRYARLVARHEFDTHYKNVAKSLYAADCEGTDKLQKKQAVIDGVRCLCDKMEEYVQRQDDPDYKGWEPQMVIRYESTTGDTENYWNLFVYCEGPNDRDDDDYLSLRTSWQHVWTDEDGKDATDDYGSEEHETRAALLRYLFYDDAQEFDETDETVSWERMTDVWVD